MGEFDIKDVFFFNMSLTQRLITESCGRGFQCMKVASKVLISDGGSRRWKRIDIQKSTETSENVQT